MNSTKSVVLNEGLVHFPIAHVCFLGGPPGGSSVLVFTRDGAWAALPYVLMWRSGLTGLEKSLRQGLGRS